VSDLQPAPSPLSDDAAASPVPAAAPAASRSESARLVSVLWRWLSAAVLIVVCVTALAVTWKTQQRVRDLEQELVRRQQDSQSLSTEARTLARQAQDSAREAAAKSALLEMRVSEVAMQRGQLEDLIQSLSRSRDENVLVDIEAAIRIALQQSAITGSAEPLITTLKQADERLQRYDQPRLEGVRRAIARDLDRVKATGVVDIGSLNIRLDEAVRLVDEMPLLSNAVASAAAAAEPRRPATVVAADALPRAGKADERAAAAASEEAASAPVAGWSPESWWPAVQQHAREWGEATWAEVRSLVRVTRIDHPEAMLIAPEQSYFIRENLKLRLLNARVALLSRQFETTQADLQVARTTIDRYFDRNSRKVGAVNDLIKQVTAQARQVNLPRPDDTLAAIAAATAGR